MYHIHRSNDDGRGIDVRACVDALEMCPSPARGAQLRALAARLLDHWTGDASGDDAERTLRRVADDLFLLGTVEVTQTALLAREAAARLSSRFSPRDDRYPVRAQETSDGCAGRSRFAEAVGAALDAPTWLGAAQRALEEARAALIHVAPPAAFGEPEPAAVGSLGALLMRARESVLGLGEALRLLGLAVDEPSPFTLQRASAACAAARHCAIGTTRTVIFGAIGIVGPAALAGESPLARLAREAIRTYPEDARYAAIEQSFGRDFLRHAL